MEIEDTLPDKLSDLLEVALGDLKKVEADDNYEVNMSDWHRSSPNRCSVCLAGSVLAKTLKIPTHHSLSMSGFFDQGTGESQLVVKWTNKRLSVPITRKMLALDGLRRGHIHEAMEYMDRPTEVIQAATIREFITVANYADNSEAFYEDMGKLVTELREAGL